MNIPRNTLNAILVLIFFLLIALPFQTGAQSKYSNSGVAKVTIKGTSNIHDWEMESPKGSCNGNIVTDGAGNLTAISGLGFTMTVNSLKSSHGSSMDNNAYKAMGAEKYPNISFSSTSATVKANGANSYSITAPGKLTISSGTKDVTLVATGKMNADKSLSINGSYKLVTTDYNVKPISIMLGAIKTEANVEIVYSLVMKPQ